MLQLWPYSLAVGDSSTECDENKQVLQGLAEELRPQTVTHSLDHLRRAALQLMFQLIATSVWDQQIVV